MWRPDLARTSTLAGVRFRRPALRRPTLRRPGDRWPTVACTVLGVLGLAAALAGLVTHVLDVGWQPMVVAAAFAHTLMFGAPIALVLLSIARRPAAVLALGVLVLVVVVQAPQYISDPVTADGPRLTVFQANLRLGSADAADLVRTVRARDVDILTTEEITGSERDRLVSAGLAARLPYDFDATAPGAGGVMIWSRYPLSREVVYPGFQLGVLSAAVTVSSQHFTIVAAHVVSPYPYPAGMWARELSALRSIMAGATTRDVVVDGDFNATVDNSQFRSLLVGGYRDAAESSGAGYLASYPADTWYPPLIGIDHVLLRDAQASDVSTVTLHGSDHRGLLAQLRLSS
jgi:endonuclease/exonuclease/phosphatase (EEP) superfamily protein YafD